MQSISRRAALRGSTGALAALALPVVPAAAKATRAPVLDTEALEVARTFMTLTDYGRALIHVYLRKCARLPDDPAINHRVFSAPSSSPTSLERG